MKKADLKGMKREELEARLKEFRDELFSARMKFRTGQFKRTSEFSRLKNEVARIKTQMRTQELESQESGVKANG